MLLFLFAFLVLAGRFGSAAQGVENRAPEGPAVAFYYAADLPPELAIYDAVVVQPEPLQGKDLSRHALAGKLYAYTSVGEVEAHRAYASRLPPAWLLGENTAWHSGVVNQAEPGWPAFFVREVIAPLWEQGFRGFFLDTLDSYHLIAKDDASRQQQEAGLVRVIRAIKQAYPEARLIFNRGFEILPQVHALAYAVVAESLFQGWNNGERRYVQVEAAGRDWLLGQLRKVRDEYRLPVVVIDYAPAHDRAAMRDLANRIRALGFVPWVTTPAIDALGIGMHEIVPRRVLLIHDESEAESLMYSPAHRFLATPLNYLGLVPEYRSVQHGLPTTPTAGRYAGIVLWFASGNDAHAAPILRWLKQQIDAQVPVAILNYPGLPLERGNLAVLGLEPAPVGEGELKFRITHRNAAVGMEIDPPLAAGDQYLVQAGADADVWLRLESGDGTRIEPIAITRWGGYAFSPQAIAALPGGLGERWVVDPFAFFKAALRLENLPVPDPTTEYGRRLLITHVDGDGFANLAEFPGSPYASQVMLDELLKRYRVPTTVSIIEGEIARNGKYPQLADDLERIAREVFRLPHVEIASHSYSHPFNWGSLEIGNYVEGASLDIPGYRFDPQAEIDGSIGYINAALAPPGKSARVFLWTGDCNPGETSLARTYAVGVGNMNGGDTTITRSRPTLTAVSPLGVPKGEYFQVYAPNQNENLYTNLWTGPFYGYERAIETFELTETPRRLKPVNIYYHTYSASKPAALKALHAVYGWAMKQDLQPVYASEYVRKVQDFNHIVLTREGDGWGVFGARNLLTLRIPASLGYPDMREGAVVGYADRGEDRYLHLSGATRTRLRLQSTAPTQAYVRKARGRIDHWQADGAGGAAFQVSAHLDGRIELGNMQHCRTLADTGARVGRKADIATVELRGGDEPRQVVVRCDRGALAARPE
jgi:uncharacterized protein (TIGR01370 family)